MSVNNQFIEKNYAVAKKYTKTVPYIIAGKRLDPRSGEIIPFVLQTADKDFDYIKKAVASTTYENDVLELYSEDEVRLFERLNRSLIEDGLLKEYQGQAKEINMVNLLSDEEINTIASTKTIMQFKSRSESITSLATLQRIRDQVDTLNRPYSFIKRIDAQIKELQQG